MTDSGNVAGCSDGVTATANDMDMFRSAPARIYPLGRSHDLVYIPIRGRYYVLSAQDTSVLRRLEQFATLRDQRNRLSEVAIVNPYETLEVLRKENLLLTRAELLGRVSAQGLPNKDVRKITACTIPTADRPSELSRSVESFARHFGIRGRTVRFIVSDGSTRCSQSEMSKCMIDKCVRKHGHTLCYMGLAEKRSLARILAEASIPLSITEFALFGRVGHRPNIGANRNALLLMTNGQAAISVDDDTVCSPCQARETTNQESIRFCHSHDPMDVWFCRDRSDALLHAKAIDIDVLAEHEALLGKTLAGALYCAANTDALDMSEVCDELIEDIWAGAGWLGVTLNGSCGDCGLYNSKGLLVNANSRTQSRLCVSKEAYDIASGSREVLRHASSCAIGHCTPFTGMYFGFDNSKLLPPFFPVYRNEDGIFATVLSKCFEGTYLGYLPWALSHQPSAPRQNQPNPLAGIRMSDIIVMLIIEWSRSGRGSCPESRMRSLGQYLIEVACTRNSDFRDIVREMSWQNAGKLISGKESRLNRGSALPAYWSADLRRDIEDVRRAVESESYASPIDVLPRGSAEETSLEVQALIRAYGELLQWWPEILTHSTKWCQEKLATCN